jgi:hypothetical protein
MGGLAIRPFTGLNALFAPAQLQRVSRSGEVSGRPFADRRR